MKNILETSSPERMPVLFIGHGSPMNAIDENKYTRALISLGNSLPNPKVILVISAHWMTNGTFVTEMSHPKTIHDFYGFPQELFEIQYPAPGSPETAQLIQKMITQPKIYGESHKWGLDHGTWSVLRHLYPLANIPVLQLSLNISQPAEYHYQLGLQISKLRDNGVLIIGSGNLVHNLSQIRWEPNSKPYDWAIEFDGWFKKKLIERDFHAVLYDFHKSTSGKLSIPTLEHYYPLHYILGAASKNDELKFEYEEIQNGSISKQSFRLG
ncbi:MAG: 4,5-DOPA dioxygenase extradiol [Bdellovibrionales bacterium]